MASDIDWDMHLEEMNNRYKLDDNKSRLYAKIKQDLIKRTLEDQKMVYQPITPPMSPAKKTDNSQELLAMIVSRLKYGGKPLPFDYIHAHELADDRVAVFVIKGTEAIVVFDGKDLFPSDQFITKLRLLM